MSASGMQNSLLQPVDSPGHFRVNHRIEVNKKAGDTLIHQNSFLLVRLPARRPLVYDSVPIGTGTCVLPGRTGKKKGRCFLTRGTGSLTVNG